MPQKSLTLVPDLRRKLKYLLDVRGGDMPGWSYRVTTQALLAAALTDMGTTTDEPTISRWKRHEDISNLVHIAPKIAQIFRCDEQSFRRNDLLTFVENTEGTAVPWHVLVATAAIAGTIAAKPLPIQAGVRALRPLVAYPTDVDWNDNIPLPELKPGSLFEVILPCPEIKVPRAASDRLHTLLFSGDGDGYVNWIPRFRGSKAFKDIGRILQGQDIRLPSFGGELKIDEQSQGKHDIVLLVTVEELPLALHAALEAEVENAGLLPALEVLARWLAPRLQNGRAAMGRRPYFVRA
jgi:hypothetical protein